LPPALFQKVQAHFAAFFKANRLPIIPRTE
jgi:hypothetical protein